MGFNTLIGSVCTRAKMTALFEPQKIMPHLFSQNAARESNFTSCRYCTYEDLIQEMEHAVSAETERKKKLGLITTQKKVNEVSAKDEKSAKSKTDPLIAAIDALKTRCEYSEK